MTFRVFYHDLTGKEVGYWGWCPTKKRVMMRFQELKIDPKYIISFRVRERWEKEYRECDFSEWMGE